jgi:V/A-type H+-transporting ATPase subunit C
MARYKAGEALRVLRYSRSGVARALAYLVLRELDLSVLFALTQGKLLEIPTDLVEIAVALADASCPIGGMAAAA